MLSFRRFMKLNICAFFLCVLLSLSFVANAQTDNTKITNHDIDFSYFKGSLEFLSNNAYQGRTDSIKLSYLTASFGYYLKNGISINLSESYQLKSSTFDSFAVDLGYYNDLNDSWAFSADLNKSFYNNSSKAIRSAVNADFNAGIIFDPGFLTFYLNGGLAFASKIDYNTAFSLTHFFELTESGNLTLAPQFTINAGTQNFYNDYREKTGKRKLVAVTNYTVASNTKFAMLDYEIDAPITFAQKKWSFFIDPIFAFPVHPVTYNTTTTISSLNKSKTTNISATENLKSIFYTSLGVDFKFK